jgi:hypothetical protein
MEWERDAMGYSCLLNLGGPVCIGFKGIDTTIINAPCVDGRCPTAAGKFDKAILPIIRDENYQCGGRPGYVCLL